MVSSTDDALASSASHRWHRPGRDQVCDVTRSNGVTTCCECDQKSRVDRVCFFFVAHDCAKGSGARHAVQHCRNARRHRPVVGVPPNSGKKEQHVCGSAAETIQHVALACSLSTDLVPLNTLSSKVQGHYSTDCGLSWVALPQLFSKEPEFLRRLRVRNLVGSIHPGWNEPPPRLRVRDPHSAQNPLRRPPERPRWPRNLR